MAISSRFEGFGQPQNKNYAFLKLVLYAIDLGVYTLRSIAYKTNFTRFYTKSRTKNSLNPPNTAFVCLSLVIMTRNLKGLRCKCLHILLFNKS